MYEHTNETFVENQITWSHVHQIQVWFKHYHLNQTTNEVY